MLIDNKKRVSFRSIPAFHRSIRSNSGLRMIFLLTVLCTGLIAGTLRVPGQYPRIQSAVNAAAPGDTILISPGYYFQNITLTKVLTVKNASQTESVTLEDTTMTPAQGYTGSNVITIDAAGAGEISGLTIVGVDRFNVYPTGVRANKDGWTIRNCLFRNLGGIQTYSSTTNVLNNTFRLVEGMSVSAGKRTKVIGNRIFGSRQEGVTATENVLIANNLFVDCSFGVNSGGQYDTVIIQNNTFSSVGNMYTNNQNPIRIGWDGAPMIIRNNILAFNNGMGIFVTAANTNLPDKFFLGNNNVYMNSTNYFIVDDPTGINGNISVDPLFCDNDSLFVLSSDSPCIDAGAADLKDADGSPSDLGMHGGPFAPFPKYSPASFSLTEPADLITVHTNQDPFSENERSVIRFRWNASFDRDQSSGLKYRLLIGTKLINRCRTTSCTTPYLTDIIDTIYALHPDSLIVELNVEHYPARTYHYTVEAVDQDGLAKRADQTRTFTLIKDNLFSPVFAMDQNYPNPFNATTSIRYGLPYPAEISIVLYDLLGREVKQVVSGPQTFGYHTAVVNAAPLGSGVYYYRFTMHTALVPAGSVLLPTLPIVKKMIVIK